MEKKPSAWIVHVESFVSSSKSTEIDAIAKLIKDGILTLEALVRDMELYLTSTDHFIRGRGVTLLAEVVDHLSSKPLDPTTVHSLVTFFTSKLADWQALHGALVGCLTLLRRKHDAGTVVGSDARALADSYLQYIHVQLLALEDRKLCFETFVCLLDIYREDVAILEKSLINGICEAIDNEKDPSCLMLTFHIVELLGEIFPDPSGPLAAIAEHLFDMLGCYFPIYFTHPKNENFHIKRDDLSVALMHAFCSTPLFEPFAIPLLLDKLSSSLPLAKIDSLRYLSNCILHYGAGRMEKYGKSIWYSLKTIILSSSPLEPSLQMSEQGGISDPQENEVYKEAILCLQTALSQQGVTNRLFISWILEDKEFDICFSSAASEISYASLSVDKRQTLSAVGSILGASAKVSSQCCDQVFCCFCPRLIDTLGISSCDSSFEQKSLKDVSSRTLTFGALYLSIELIASCRDFTISSGEFFNGSVSGENKWFHLLQSVYIPLVYALGSLVTGHCSKEENTLTADCKCAVKGLQILATFPGKLHGLESGYEYILGVFKTIITGMFKYSVIWKMALESLVQIGSFIEHIGCYERKTIYSSVVVDNIISLLGFDDYKMPLSLKLEAVLSIGAICPAYMYRVIRELEVLIFRNFVEAFVDGNENYASTLVCLLESYSRQVLPWCSTKGNYEEVASHFAFCVWKKMENISVSDTLYRRDVSEALSLAMKFVVGNSKEEYQLMIIRKAYSVIQSRIISPLTKSASFSHSNLENMQLNLESITLSLNDKLLTSLFADVLIALRPQVPIPDIKFMLDLLSVFLLKGHISAAQALGSIVNKWPSGVGEADKMPCTLEEAVNIIFNRCMFSVDTKISRKTDGNSAVHIDLIDGLAWIGKGLLMRGHEKSKEIIMVLFKSMMINCIETVPSKSDMVGSYDQHKKSFILSKSAADAFNILMSDSEICLNKKFHATERPLYRQKFFSSILPIFLSSIKESDSSTTRDLLYRAFGHVISNTPQATILMEAKKLILPLFEGLSVLSADHTNKDLVYSLLLVFSGILMDDDGKNIVINNAHIIINCLLKLTSYPDATLIRETAIQCLVAISELPHARIYPMRQQVLRAIMKALDDPKRIVRVEAGINWLNCPPGDGPNHSPDCHDQPILQRKRKDKFILSFR